MPIVRPSELETGKWWDRPWSLVDGCTAVSEGCANCWSRDIARRFKKDWTPKFRDDRLDIPLRRKKPTVWAVWNDLFHEDVSNAEIAAAFGVMAACPQHVFMVLTKRAERLPEWFAWVGEQSVSWPDPTYYCMANTSPEGKGLDIDGQFTVMDSEHDNGWPLPNVALGVTAENQHWADIRVPHLLQTPATYRFVSYEPALGAVGFMDPFYGFPDLDLIIAGGESGPKARPSHPDRFRSVRDQCAAAGTQFLMKQMVVDGKMRKHTNELPPDLRIREWFNA